MKKCFKRKAFIHSTLVSISGGGNSTKAQYTQRMVQKFLMKILSMNFFPIIYRHYALDIMWIKAISCKGIFPSDLKFYQQFHVQSFVKSHCMVNFKSVKMDIKSGWFIHRRISFEKFIFMIKLVQKNWLASKLENSFKI